MFKIGDKVRLTKSFDNAPKGAEGVVVCLPGIKNGATQTTYQKCYTIKFFNKNQGIFGHNCNGKTPDFNGYWVKPDCLELIKPKSEKIVITHDGKSTLARLYEDNKVVKSAEAYCNPKDEFNFLDGAKIAFERLTEEKEEPPKFDKSMLTNGRFGYMEQEGWFVVVGDKIIYKKGGYDFIETFNEDGRGRWYGIKYIVESTAFDYACKAPNKVIWCAPDFDPKKVTK